MGCVLAIGEGVTMTDEISQRMMEIQNEIATALDPVGTKYSKDSEIFIMAIKALIAQMELAKAIKTSDHNKEIDRKMRELKREIMRDRKKRDDISPELQELEELFEDDEDDE